MIWIISSRSVPIFSTINNWEVIYLWFFRWCVNIAFQHALASLTKRKITLAGDACSNPSITIRSHNLHASDIRKALGEIASYHTKDYLSLLFYFWFLQVMWLLAFLWPFLYVSPAMVPTIILLLDFCVVLSTLLQPTHKTETGGTTNRKPAGPIIMMGRSGKLSSKWIIFITLFSASA